jgi:hypothetical protein
MCGNTSKGRGQGAKYLVSIDVLAELSRRSKHEGFWTYLLHRMEHARKGKGKADCDLNPARDSKILRFTETMSRQETKAMHCMALQTATLLGQIIESTERGEALREQLKYEERRRAELVAQGVAQCVGIAEPSSETLNNAHALLYVICSLTAMSQSSLSSFTLMVNPPAL